MAADWKGGEQASHGREFRRDHNHHKSSGRGEGADPLQPSIGNYTASFPLHSIFQSKSQAELRFKGKEKRCLFMEGVTGKFPPPSIDHSYQSAFIQLGAESISLNLALPLERETFEDQGSPSSGTSCCGCTAKVAMGKSPSSGFLRQIKVDTVFL